MVEITVVRPFSFDPYKGSTEPPSKSKVKINPRKVKEIIEDERFGHRIIMENGNQYITDTKSLKLLKKEMMQWGLL